MRIQVLLASAATAIVLSCGSASAAPTAGGDTAKGQNADRGIVLAQRSGGGRAAMGGGGGGARVSGAGATPRFSGRGDGARFSGEAARPRFSEAARARGDRPRRWASGGRYWRPGWGYGYGWGPAWGLGLGYGAGLGYGWGYPYYADTYYYGAPVVYSGGGGGGEAYCAQRFKSYDPRSGTYLGYDRKRHPCP